MAEHPNAELLRKGYAAFSAGDLETVRAQMDPNIVWHVPGKHHLAGDYTGVDDVFNLFGRQFQETGGTLRLDVHDVMANDTHAVVLATISAQKDGKSLNNERFVHVLHVSDGRQTESWLLPENADVADDFWG